jgi:hypothetical protein
VLHASDRGVFEDRIGSVGKQAGDESGKDPVNESDEEISLRRFARVAMGREFQFTLSCVWSSLRGAKRRSNPSIHQAARWIASLRSQ